MITSGERVGVTFAKCKPDDPKSQREPPSILGHEWRVWAGTGTIRPGPLEVLHTARALLARDRQALRVAPLDWAAGTLALSVSFSSSAPRGIVKRSCIVASSSVRLRTMQQYSSDRPLGSLK